MAWVPNDVDVVKSRPMAFDDTDLLRVERAIGLAAKQPFHVYVMFIRLMPLHIS